MGWCDQLQALPAGITALVSLVRLHVPSDVVRRSFRSHAGIKWAVERMASCCAQRGSAEQSRCSWIGIVQGLCWDLSLDWPHRGTAQLVGQCGAVSVLLDVLSHSSTGQPAQEVALGAVANLAVDAANSREMCGRAGFVAGLVDIVNGPAVDAAPWLRGLAVETMCYLSEHEEARMALCSCGAVTALRGWNLQEAELKRMDDVARDSFVDRARIALSNLGAVV